MDPYREQVFWACFHVFSSNVVVLHMYYVSDIYILGEATINNIWTIKTILRCFELDLGLYIKFSKSSLIWFNVFVDFLMMVEGALNFKRGIFSI